MKHLSYSVVILLIFISVWGIYIYYSDIAISQLKNELYEDVLTAVRAEDWTEAKEEFVEFKNDWKKYRRIAHLFFNTEKINEIDLSIATCEFAIDSAHAEETSSDLGYLIELLSFLHESEQLSAENLL